MRRKVALLAYSVIAVNNLVFGAIYLTSDRFLSYHSQAVGSAWEDVDHGTQALILALMKLAGGGWLALGLITIALVLSELKQSRTLVRWALPVGTLMFYTPSLAATWSGYRETGAQAPWIPSLVMIGVVLVAIIIDAPWSRSPQSKG
ncbi:MAG TPA: hypothetical protein VIN05_04120 [Roseovarius sp.]